MPKAIATKKIRIYFLNNNGKGTEKGAISFLTSHNISEGTAKAAFADMVSQKQLTYVNNFYYYNKCH